MPTRRSSPRGKGKRPPEDLPDVAAVPAAPPPPADPLAGLSPRDRELRVSKAIAEDKHRQGLALATDEVILILPGYDPRQQAGDCTFDAAAADRACEFFARYVFHIEGEWAGTHLKLEPWQRAIVANLFGWKRPDGFRRYREFFLEVPRKNGKTPLAAGIVLVLLATDHEPGAQIYSAAGDKAQAALLFRHARGSVERAPALQRRLQIHASGKSIEYRAMGSFYRALSKEGKTKHGLNSHAVVVDELHVQQNSELVDVLTSSTGTRRQPLIVYITTADWARPSLCNEKEAHAEKVAANLVEDPEFLPVIYRAPADAKWDEEATWKIANPNYGISIKPDEMAREARKARRSPRDMNTFKRLRLNLKTQAEIAWVPMDLWRACGDPLIVDGDLDRWIDEMGLEGMPCFAGLDLSSNKDLTAFVLYFPHNHAVLPWFWSCRYRAEERELVEGVSYLGWAQKGLLELCPGKSIDLGMVEKRIVEVGERFLVREINFDRWGAQSIATRLEHAGFDMVKFGQGFASLSAPSKALEVLWLEHQLRHGGHEVLAWNAGNVMVVGDEADNIKPSKKHSAERIDGMVALVMAVGGALASEGEADFSKGFTRL